MPRPRYIELTRLSNARLEEIFAAARGPKAASLAGSEWIGWNTTPLAPLLGIRKFIKGFFDSGAGLEGYNIPARQNRLGEPWLHRPDAVEPKRFGFYRVDAAAGEPHPGTLLLDYGASPRNP